MVSERARGPAPEEYSSGKNERTGSSTESSPAAATMPTQVDVKLFDSEYFSTRSSRR